MNHIFPRFTRIPLIISVIWLNVYFVFVNQDFTLLYFFIWLGGFGLFLLKYRERIIARLARWNVSPAAKFIILGYGAVLTEEFIVALVHSLTEGFELMRFGVLILQFWNFNIFAFTGFIIGWYFLLKRYRYSMIDIFLIAGIWGLYAERVIAHLLHLSIESIGTLFFILPIMCTYNLVIAPAILSMTQRGENELSFWKKYPYSFLVLFACSVIPMILVGIIRSHFPGGFPSCEYIPCF
jgi:hypothetical protein